MGAFGRFVLFCCVLLLPCMVRAAAPQSSSEPPVVWLDEDASGEPRVHVHLFWSETCPHCRTARADLESLAAARSWLVLHEYEVSRESDAGALYVRVAEAVGDDARVVPGIAFCGRMIQGEPGRERLAEELDACRAESTAIGAETTEVAMPFVGSVDVRSWSLLLTTSVLAGLDAFNPCAFFVLLVLLGVLVHAHDRRRMALVAGVFIAVSGLWYFMFMAAWLNVFLWIGELRVVTLLAGLVAVVLGAVDIKDFVAPGRGPSLSIPESARTGLFRRMRGLVRTGSRWSAVTGALVLAAIANTYELLCTAGFPLVYTRVLTLANLDSASYYLWLALYNVIYVLPLAAIALVFVWTLGARKLQEHQGRALKLLAGAMMLTMGLVLVIAPSMLGRLDAAAGLLAFAIAVTIVGTWLDRRIRAR